jgi:hypothetical protein
LTKTIEITITPKGETKVETKGFTGGSCREASRLIEQALGEKAGEQMTAEFYQAERSGKLSKRRGKGHRRSP